MPLEWQLIVQMHRILLILLTMLTLSIRLMQRLLDMNDPRAPVEGNVGAAYGDADADAETYSEASSADVVHMPFSLIS